jgi:uncharacterized protein
MAASPATVHALRLPPGADLLGELHAAAERLGLAAGFVVTVVGSLTRAVLRYANRPDAESAVLEGHFEIVGCTGTVAPGGCHVHVCLADGDGRVLGGHLMPGSAVYTTAEVVLGDATALAWARAPCPRSGYDELVGAPRGGGGGGGGAPATAQ